MHRNFTAIALALLVLAGCSDAAEDQTEVNDPRDAGIATPVTDPEIEAALDAEMMEGAWGTKEERGLHYAFFGPPETDARISLVCDPATRELSIGFPDEATTPQTYRLAGGGDVLELVLESDGSEVLPYLEGSVDPANPVITAFARGPESVVITYPGGVAERVPSDPAVASVLEACS